MPDTGKAGGGTGSQGAQPSGPVQRYRFKVRMPDGRELISTIAAVRLPPHLEAPQWNLSEIGPGEKATMSVAAPGRDGEIVNFLIDRRGPKGWESIGHTSGKVKEGRAQVDYEMPHVPPDQGGAPLAHEPLLAHHDVRFIARSADGTEVVSQPLRLRSAHPPLLELKLGTAHFGHGRYRVGDTADVVVHGQSGDGHDVRFVIEKEQDGKWAPIQELRGTLSQGIAHARWPIATAPEGQREGGKEGDTKAGGEQPKPMRVRLRAIAGFASAISEPIEIDLPAHGELAEPEWSHAHPDSGSAFEHGEEAVIRVKARGAEQRRVRFLVEQQRRDGEWKPYAAAYGIVLHGVAQARIPMLHAADPEDQVRGEPVQVRFHAELA